MKLKAKNQKPKVRPLAALLCVARAHDLAGRREAARKTYQQIVDEFEKQRAATAARIGLLTPYRRPLRASGV